MDELGRPLLTGIVVEAGPLEERPPWRRRPVSLSVPPRTEVAATTTAEEAEAGGAHDVTFASGAGDLSPLRWLVAAPLLRRQTSRRQRRPVLWPVLPGGAGDLLPFPHATDCVHCSRQLEAAEVRGGTGLCSECLETCEKDCSICGNKLLLKQLQWGSGLCRVCFEACDKECKMCGLSLADGQLHWNTGLCDTCYDSCEKTCKLCGLQLHKYQLRWGSGLCDPCYNSCQKECRICSRKLQVRQLRWGTGLCDACYDESEKTCIKCGENIALGSMHYRTGLCDTCYDTCDKNCKFCNARLEFKQLHSGTGLCNLCHNAREKTCQMCKLDIDSQQLHWGTGLCDKCYNACAKVCKFCDKRLLFGELHWGSGLCDDCYRSCEKTCSLCQAYLALGELHWGTRVCDTCFDSCKKECARCRSRIDVGQLHWGTGLCDNCYDVHLETASHGVGLSRGVRAAIGAQLIFYLAPAMLQPSLYLQLRAIAGRKAGAPGIYAAVLMTASVAAMVLPVPLGLWAEWRSEREAYTGISLAAAVAAAILVVQPPAPAFAAAWAVLNGPPAIRGVRAAYFAKHVAPEELSRAGQLASSAGLLGGFVGPMISAALSRAFGDGSDGCWPGGFAVGAALAAVSCATCAAALAAFVPPRSRRQRKAVQGRGAAGFSTGHSERCELCSQILEESERQFALALCDTCYNNYAGTNYNFRRFQRHVLIGFCLIASLLEASMNAGIIATFQPIVVTHFNWGNSAIASVNLTGAGLSVVISFLLAHLRLKERTQTAAAAGLYLVGVVIFTVQPLREWRLVVGLMLGIKAQILFMAPFTAIFSRLIGKVRVTNWLTTALCLAPAIGAALGTAAAPWFISVADTPLFMVVSFPALLAVAGIAAGWGRMEGKPVASAHAASQNGASNPSACR